MNLVARCQQHNWNRVAFIGAAKHAGKTTALNSFIDQVAESGKTLGLCSVGLDGERLDTILGVEKPAIYAPTGALVASAERALAESDARLEWFEALPIDSPLGTVMLARVLTPGRVVLAGVRQRQHVEHVVPRLQSLGADYCLVDGAFDRVAAAAPHLVDAAVLAVGAIAGRTVEDVVRQAFPYIQRFRLPETTLEWKAQLQPAHANRKIGIHRAGELIQIPPHQAVYGLTADDAWTPDVEAVFIPGALTDSLIDTFASHPTPLQVVVSHPAQVLASGDSLRKLYRRDHALSVWTPLPLLAIAVNPHSILGFDLPRRALLEAVADLAPEIPVYDAVTGSTASNSVADLAVNGRGHGV